jgi:hypothetical protein
VGARDRGPGRNRRPGAGKRAQSSPISASSTCQHDIGSHLRQLPRHRPRPRDITAGQTILDALSISLLGSTRSEERSAWVPRSVDAAHPMVPRGWNGGPAHPGHQWPEYPTTGRSRRFTVSMTSPSRGIALPEEPGPWDLVAVARRPYGSGCPPSPGHRCEQRRSSDSAKPYRCGSRCCQYCCSGHDHHRQPPGSTWTGGTKSIATSTVRCFF